MRKSDCILYGLLLVFLYFLPAIITGDNHYILIHDFLDSTVAHIKSMIDNGIVFDNNGIIPILSGIPRSYYLTSADLKVWLFLLLPPYWAVLANLFLIKATAFLGLFLLLDSYVLAAGPARSKAAFITAVLFSLVPFYPDYGISSAGVPLVAYAFINLFEKRRVAISFAIMVYYALFSWLVLGGVFVCASAALVILVYMIRQKKFPALPFIALCLLALVYVAANFQLFVNYFNPMEATHREEIKPLGEKLPAIGAALGILFVSQFHAGTCCAFVMVAAFIVLWRSKHAENPRWNHLLMAFVSLAALMVFTSVFKIIFSGFKLIQEFQFDRFFFLYPAMCYTLFGAVIHTFLKEKRVKLLALLASLVLVTGLAFDHFVTDETLRVCGVDGHPGFRDFYDTELFGEIKGELCEPGKELKVACLGMYPAVAEYNGISTVDGYIQIYPLEYKHRFQRVIQAELDKDPVLWDYFCNWGERCYLYSAELGRYYMYSGRSGKSVEALDIDCEALSGLGCGYILSAVGIDNYESLGLRYVGSYSHPGSYWNIRVYSL